MLRSRVIPCLLVHRKGLTKTEGFKVGKYVGDPINAVRIFNEKEVDELIVLDIDKSVEQKAPDFELIKNLANESRMPLCYGGGVKTVEQAKKIVSLGAEKVAISSLFFEDLEMVKAMCKGVGNQSVVVVLDVKKVGLFTKSYEIFTHNGKKKATLKLNEVFTILNDISVGEVVINNIDLDGKMSGYDLDLAVFARKNLDMPLTILGGAGKYDDLKKLISKFKIIGAAAGSLFVFKGIYKAVLINYPNRKEKFKIVNETNNTRP